MKLTLLPCNNEDDYWRMRNFLREVFLLNERREHSWNVARLDYWRWHLILTCQACDPVEQVTTLWETPHGQIAAALHPVEWGEFRLHVHPHFRTAALEDEMLAHAEVHLARPAADGRRLCYVSAFDEDTLRQEVLAQRGYSKREGIVYHWQRDLESPGTGAPISEAPLPPGYTIRSMGALDEHPARSWASWRAFHSDEGDENYDGDWSWYQNVQSAPLYRRDLDVVAAAPDGSIAAFCTIYFDDFTRSAVSVLVGTAAEHWRRGLGKAVMTEGMRRLQKLGCTRIFANAYDPPANALYGSVMTTRQVSESWFKALPGTAS
ncbi:MAG: GNAT family N-acetyltransferase [Chloroflexota bacterium]